jgi:hypothetical protein
MNILNRLKKLESNNPNALQCFCNKTFIDLCYGEPNADALTYCANCKDHFDYWQNLARDAETSENITDEK